MVHKGTSFAGQFASDVNPFHAASLPGRFGTGGHSQQPGVKGNGLSSGGGTFTLEATDDAAPEFATAGGGTSGINSGSSNGIEALEGGTESTEQDLSLGATVGAKAVALPLGSSSSGHRASVSASERLDACSKVRCAETGFGSHPKVDLWGGVSGNSGTGGTDNVVCASKTAAPLDGLCLVGAGTFTSARTYCQRAGARLCTAGEMSRGLGWNTGCGSSMPFLWTQTRCNASSGDSDHSGHHRHRSRRLSPRPVDSLPANGNLNHSDSYSNGQYQYQDRMLSSITVSTARLAKAYQQKTNRHHRDSPSSRNGDEHFLLLSQQRLLGGSSKHVKCGNALTDRAEGPPVCCADAKCPEEEANKAADWAAEAERCDGSARIDYCVITSKLRQVCDFP